MAACMARRYSNVRAGLETKSPARKSRDIAPARTAGASAL
jgi:hypothetical protein